MNGENVEKKLIKQMKETTLMHLCLGSESILGEDLQWLYVQICDMGAKKFNDFEILVLDKLPPQFYAPYQGLIAGFDLWDTTQRIYGAPGAELMCALGSQDEKFNVKLAQVMSEVVGLWKNHTSF